MQSNLPKYILTKENSLREDPNGNITFVAQALEFAKIHAADAKTAWAECEALREKVAALEAVLSAAEPQPAPSVAVKALEWSDEDNGDFIAQSIVGWYHIGLPHLTWNLMTPNGDVPSFNTLKEAKAAAQADYEARVSSALSAQVQDVAGWQDISTLEPKDGMIVMGWGEYRERDGFSPAFMRWYDSVGGWNVNAMPFYPTHWMPLPAAPAKQEG